MRSLEELSLEGTTVSDESVPRLCTMQWLALLSLRRTRVSFAGMQQLHAALPTWRVFPNYLPDGVPGGVWA
jgi:hypothetical protein